METKTKPKGDKMMHWFGVNFDLAFGVPVGKGCLEPEVAKAAFIKALEKAGVDFEWSGPSNDKEAAEFEAGKPLIEWGMSQDVLNTGYEEEGDFKITDARYEVEFVERKMKMYPEDDQMEQILSDMTKLTDKPGVIGKYRMNVSGEICIIRPNTSRHNLKVVKE